MHTLQGRIRDSCWKTRTTEGWHLYGNNAALFDYAALFDPNWEWEFVLDVIEDVCLKGGATLPRISHALAGRHTTLLRVHP